MKLLFIKGSPRAEKSTSAYVADGFLAAYRAKNPGSQIDEMDLWREPLPEFDGDKAAAKMSFFGKARWMAPAKPPGSKSSRSRNVSPAPTII